MMKWTIFIGYSLAYICRYPVDTMGYCVGDSKISDVYFTTGGKAPENSPCCFPFVYEGVTYSECVLVEHHRPWCSIDSLYQNKWGNCVPKPVNGSSGCIPNSKPSQVTVTTEGTVPEGTPCCFPFFFEMKWYSECIDPLLTGEEWCGVDNVFADENKRWGKCIEKPGTTIGVTTPFSRSPTIPVTMVRPTTKAGVDIPLAAIIAPVVSVLAVAIFIVIIVIYKNIQSQRQVNNRPEDVNEGYYEYVGMQTTNIGKLDDSSLPRNRYSSHEEVLNLAAMSIANQQTTVNNPYNNENISAGYMKPV